MDRKYVDVSDSFRCPILFFIVVLQLLAQCVPRVVSRPAGEFVAFAVRRVAAGNNLLFEVTKLKVQESMTGAVR